MTDEEKQMIATKKQPSDAKTQRFAAVAIEFDT